MTDYVNAIWRGDRLHMLRRDAAGKLETEVVRADYATFVRKSDWHVIADHVSRSSSVRHPVRADGDYMRIRFRENHMRRAFDEWLDGRVPTFEADVDPVRRFMIDTGATVQVPRMVSLDIETDSRVPFRDKHKARVLCWTLTDYATGEQVCDWLDEFTDEDERRLLQSLLDALEQWDMVCAWNGERFDFEVLKERVIRLFGKQHVGLRRWLLLDHMQVFRKFNISASESGDEKQSVALDRTWEAVTGESEGKLARYGVGELSHLRVGGRYAYEFWAAGGENRRLLVKYNARDSAMPPAIEKKTGYLANHVEVCRICGVFPETRGMRGIRFVETFMMRLSKERGIRAPTKWGSDVPDDGEQFAGGWVFPVERTGLIRNVHVFDFSGMYPSIMISLNMSPETRAPEHDVAMPANAPGWLPPKPPPGIAVAPITGKAFRTDVDGMFPVALRRLRQLRAQFEKLRDEAVPGSPEYVMAKRSTDSIKNIVNTFYGATGSRWCRYFTVDVAESCTQTGVYLIRETTIPEAENAGMTTIAADTDSGFEVGVSKEEMEAFVERCNTQVYPALLERLGARENVVKLAYETEFELMISCAKKRYAARRRHYKGKYPPAIDPKTGKPTKPVIKGLEYMRGDWNKLARDLQKAVIDKLLYVGQDMPKAYGIRAEDFHPLVAPLRDRIISGELELDEFVVSKSLRKELDEYAVRLKNDGSEYAQAAQVVVAKWMEANGYDVAEGTRIEYVVTDGAASPMQVVHVDVFKPGTEDRHYIWEKLVWPPTGRLLEAVFPEFRWEKYARTRPRNTGKGKAKVLAGQEAFDFLKNDWGDGVPKGL